MSYNVFISYRRDDAPMAAAAIDGQLRALGDLVEVFRDERGIDPGEAFAHVIEEAINTADLVLVIIGPRWQPERLNGSTDWVRREVRWAFQRRRQVLPVLVEGGRVPRTDAVPAEVRPLLAINAFAVGPDDVAGDLRKLVERVSGAAAEAEESFQESVRAVDEMIDSGADAELTITPGGPLMSPRRAGRAELHDLPIYGSFRCRLTVPRVPDPAFGPAKVQEFTFTIHDDGSVVGRWPKPAQGLSALFGAGYLQLDGDAMLMLLGDPSAPEDFALALRLEGLVDGGERFQVTIPIQRKTGRGYSGVDEVGRTWFLIPGKENRTGL